jgi:hypothetical protein
VSDYEVTVTTFGGFYSHAFKCFTYSKLGEFKYMQKTKETTGTVCGWKYNEIFVKPDGLYHEVKIGDKVSITSIIPERKTEITESQFDEAVKEFFPFAFQSGIAGPTWGSLKQKLFNQE